MKKLINRNNAINWMYAPALLLFLVFLVYPFFSGIMISFTNWNGYSQSYQFTGLDNYVRLLGDQAVIGGFINTVYYGLGSTIIQNIFGLAFALFLNSKFKGRYAVRTVIYLPVMIAGVIMGYIFYFMVQYDGGAINDIMLLLGLEPVDWMAEGLRAVAILTGINSFQYVGVAMIIFLAGLQSIPKMYYEVAMMDGVGGWGQFKYVTLPLLIPAIKTSFVLNIIGGLKLYDVIMALTAGGPGFSTHSLSTLVTYTYFRSQHAGYSATIGLFTFVFIMVVSIVVLKYFSRKEIEY